MADTDKEQEIVASVMQKVEDFMNSDAFAADDGGRGLRGLATEMLERCKEVVKRQGERIPK